MNNIAILTVSLPPTLSVHYLHLYNSHYIKGESQRTQTFLCCSNLPWAISFSILKETIEGNFDPEIWLWYETWEQQNCSGRCLKCLLGWKTTLQNEIAVLEKSRKKKKAVLFGTKGTCCNRYTRQNSGLEGKSSYFTSQQSRTGRQVALPSVTMLGTQAPPTLLPGHSLGHCSHPVGCGHAVFSLKKRENRPRFRSGTLLMFLWWVSFCLCSFGNYCHLTAEKAWKSSLEGQTCAGNKVEKGFRLIVFSLL